MHASNPYAPPQAAVHDVSMPSGQQELADLSARLAGFVVDSLILGCIVYPPLILAVAADSGVFGADGVLVTTAALLAMLVTFAIWAWFTIRYVNANGQSIGKKLLNIKVVRSDGSRASLGRIFWLRNVVNGLLGLIPLYAFVEHLFIFGDSRQCLHDRIADTIVIKA